MDEPVDAPPERRAPAAVLAGHRGRVVSLVFAAGGRLLITGDDDDTTIIWDLTQTSHPIQVASLSRGDTGTSAESGHPATTPPRGSGARHRDKAIVGPRPRRPALAGPGLPSRGTAFSPEQRLLATGHVDGTTTLWRLIDPARPDRTAVLLPGHARSGSVNAVAFSPDGLLLVAGYESGVARVWDVSDPTRPTRTRTLLGRWGWRSEILTVAFSPDQQVLATGGFREGRRPAILWDLTGTRPTRIAGLRPPRPSYFAFNAVMPSVFAVAFSPDARFAVTAAELMMWNSWPFIGQIGPIHHDSMVALWDLADPRRPSLTATLTQQGGVGRLPSRTWHRYGASTYTGHTATTRTVAFSPDGRLLGTGSDDRTVILWDLADPSRPRPTTTLIHANRIRALAFSPYTGLLATGSGTTVNLWHLP